MLNYLADEGLKSHRWQAPDYPATDDVDDDEGDGSVVDMGILDEAEIADDIEDDEFKFVESLSRADNGREIAGMSSQMCSPCFVFRSRN